MPHLHSQALKCRLLGGISLNAPSKPRQQSIALRAEAITGIKEVGDRAEREGAGGSRYQQRSCDVTGTVHAGEGHEEILSGDSYRPSNESNCRDEGDRRRPDSSVSQEGDARQPHGAAEADEEGDEFDEKPERTQPWIGEQWVEHSARTGEEHADDEGCPRHCPSAADSLPQRCGSRFRHRGCHRSSTERRERA